MFSQENSTPSFVSEAERRILSKQDAVELTQTTTVREEHTDLLQRLRNLLVEHANGMCVDMPKKKHFHLLLQVHLGASLAWSSLPSLR